MTCRSPRECLDIILNPQNKEDDFTEHDILYDSQIFNSETIQRPYRYLRKLMTSSQKVHKTSSTHFSSNFQRRLKTKTENSTVSNADENTHCYATFNSEIGVKRSSFEDQMRLETDIKTEVSTLFDFRSPRKTNMSNAPKRNLVTYSNRVEEDDSPVFGNGGMNYRFGFKSPRKTCSLEILDAYQTPNISNAPTRNQVKYPQRVEEDDQPVLDHGKLKGKFEANIKPETPTINNADDDTNCLETLLR